MPAANDNPTSFEVLLKRLEEIVRALEGEDLELERSIDLYEEGMTLARQCHSRLDAAQRRVEVLRRGAGETVDSVPFTPSEEA